ncbi:MAG TPA: DUF4834 family protein [Draconibacterium sp.]|nr:DUF4834 family protein [Draconibacterium sp.]
MNLLVILYFVGFLRTVFVIAIIYLVVRAFSRYILPMLVEKGVKNMQQKMYEQQRQNQQSNKHEGEVTIEYNDKDKKNRNQNEGDYVDFEEVD